MKSPMNCDQVFDILTRGPFPNGETTDAAVELHLIACHECRQLAEALRPAINLFHEAVPSTELRDLPGYTGALCAYDQRFLAEPKTATMDRPRAPTRWYQQLRHVATSTEFLMPRVALALMIGATFMGLLWTTERPNASSSASTAGVWAAGHAPTIRPEGKQLLLALALPNGCRHGLPDWLNGDRNQRPLAAAEESTLQCCTQCHAAKLASATLPESLGKIVRSCHACHPSQQ